MWSIIVDYRRARVSRYRKAILYSICAGIAALLFGANIIQIILAGWTVGILSWWWNSRTVEHCRNIHTLGGRK